MPEKQRSKTPQINNRNCQEKRDLTNLKPRSLERTRPEEPSVQPCYCGGHFQE